MHCKLLPLFMVGLRTCGSLRLRGTRCFSLAGSLHSGHNRWSKIRHDKAKVDASVSKQRATLANEIQLASKADGPDPQFNPRLATIITAAKKQGYAKAAIETAIARGQGRSPSGAALESLTIEAMVPPSVAVIVECQTDSKARTLADIKLVLRDSGGTTTPTSHMFDKKGRIVFEGAEGVGEEEIFDRAVEAGAIDVQMEKDGKVVIDTESNQTTAVADAMAASSGLKLASLDIIWDPKEELMVDVASPEVLESFLDQIHDHPSVQEVYTNAS